MAAIYSDNINYVGNKPNFERDRVKTLAQLLAEEPAKRRYPFGHIVFCEEDNNHYKFNYNYENPSSTQRNDVTGWFEKVVALSLSQTTGDNTGAVMSQAAITAELKKTNNEIAEHSTVRFDRIEENEAIINAGEVDVLKEVIYYKPANKFVAADSAGNYWDTWEGMEAYMNGNNVRTDKIYLCDNNIYISYNSNLTSNDKKAEIYIDTKAASVNLVNPMTVSKDKYVFAGEGANYGAIWGAEAAGKYFVSNFIPVDKKNIISNCAVRPTTAIASYGVYDVNKKPIRCLQQEQYNYEEGDYYVVIGFQGDIVPYANYGTELIEIEYGETKNGSKIPALLENVHKIKENLAIIDTGKLDKKTGANLVKEVAYGKYIALSGVVGEAASDRYSASDYIPVNGQNISSNAIVVSNSAIAAYAVYDIDKNFLRADNVGGNYLYQDGDYYVRLTFHSNTGEPMANYGNELLPYEPYMDYLPLVQLEKRVDTLEESVGKLSEKKDVLLPYQPNCIYNVYNSLRADRQYIAKLFLSHLLDDIAEYKDRDICFDNKQRVLPILPITTEQIVESEINVNIVSESEYNDASFAAKVRTTNTVLSKNVTPRILTIGDSVTNGYGAGANKDVSWLPNRYWGFAKMLFEMDKIDDGDNADIYNAVFLGKETDDSFTINYKNVKRTVRCKADGKGGANLQQLFGAEWGSPLYANPFYDESKNTFSIKSYLNNYRTMDDLGVRLNTNSADPHGEPVVGSDGKTYSVGNKITSQELLLTYDVCTPTHIFVNLVHNTGEENYKTYIPQTVSIIQSELPKAVVCLMVIDETGTFFPADYPNYQASQITMGALHTKNSEIYNYIKENIEDEANGVYLLAMQFVQPTARSYPTYEYVSADSIEKNEKSAGLKYPAAAGPNYHPNNYAHSAWGYAMYSFLKWVMSK